jgi:cation diffusion facilitator CzcD-associated flavoprotein CzcO
MAATARDERSRPMAAIPRVVVVGSGFAGLEALFLLRMRLHDKVDLTLVSDRAPRQEDARRRRPDAFPRRRAIPCRVSLATDGHGLQGMKGVLAD